MVALSSKRPQVVDGEEAELLACQRVVAFAIEMGYKDIIIEGEKCHCYKSFELAVWSQLLSTRGYCYGYSKTCNKSLVHLIVSNNLLIHKTA